MSGKRLRFLQAFLPFFPSSLLVLLLELLVFARIQTPSFIFTIPRATYLTWKIPTELLGCQRLTHKTVNKCSKWNNSKSLKTCVKSHEG